MSHKKIDPVTPSGLRRSQVNLIQENCYIRRHDKKPGAYCGLCRLHTDCWPNIFRKEPNR
jgi:hypothetical protein